MGKGAKLHAWIKHLWSNWWIYFMILSLKYSSRVDILNFIDICRLKCRLSFLESSCQGFRTICSNSVKLSVQFMSFPWGDNKTLKEHLLPEWLFALVKVRLLCLLRKRERCMYLVRMEEMKCSGLSTAKERGLWRQRETIQQLFCQ